MDAVRGLYGRMLASNHFYGGENNKFLIRVVGIDFVRRVCRIRRIGRERMRWCLICVENGLDEREKECVLRWY